MQVTKQQIKAGLLAYARSQRHLLTREQYTKLIDAAEALDKSTDDNWGTTPCRLYNV